MVDLVIVGAGLVGLASAYRLLCVCPRLKIIVVEKEMQVGAHQSTHNSGVLHAGLYYRPNSYKARLAVKGLRLMVQFCAEYGIRYEQCGKVVVATTQGELPRLHELLERGYANGLRGIRLLSRDELKEIEPHVDGIAAIHVPEEGIVDYGQVCEKLAKLLVDQGAEVRLGARVYQMKKVSPGWIVLTTAGEFHTRCVICCGGLHADRLVLASGDRSPIKIVPFRGEYYRIRREKEYLVKNLIYPVPDSRFPFLGVHFTRLIGGGVEAGPNAVLALAREGYTWGNVNLKDLFDVATFGGFWRFVLRHPFMCCYEVYRSFSRSAFCRSLQRLVPEIQQDDLEPGGSGVRAQAMYPDGRLVEDFYFLERPGILHVLNAPSPAATASLAIGEEIAKKVLKQLD